MKIKGKGLNLRELIFSFLRSHSLEKKATKIPFSIEQIGTKEYPVSISMLPSLLQCEKRGYSKLLQPYDQEISKIERVANGSAIDAYSQCVYIGLSNHEEIMGILGELYPAADLNHVADLGKNYVSRNLNEGVDEMGVSVGGEIDNVYFRGTLDQIRNGQVFDMKASQFGGNELLYNYFAQLAGYSFFGDYKIGGILRASSLATPKRKPAKDTQKQVLFFAKDIFSNVDFLAECLLKKLAKRIKDIRNGEEPTRSISARHCKYCSIGIEQCLL